MLMRGYIDESYSAKLFTLSCLMSDPPDWHKMELSWKKKILAKNKKLHAQGRRQLSRYHAADCSSLVNEFEGWTVTEQIEFTKQLLGVIKGRFLNVIAYSVPLEALEEIFPEHKKGDLGPCYALLLKLLMTEFTSQLEDVAKLAKQVKPIKLVLIHDRCSYDVELLRAFNQMMEDPGFTGKHVFSTIAPMAWEDCIPLQLADLLAYENFKDSERRETGRKRRKTLEVMLANRLGGRCRTFTAKGLRKLRDLMESRAESKF